MKMILRRLYVLYSRGDITHTTASQSIRREENGNEGGGGVRCRVEEYTKKKNIRIYNTFTHLAREEDNAGWSSYLLEERKSIRVKGASMKMRRR